MGERKPWRDPEPGIFETGPYALADGRGGALLALKADLPDPPTLRWHSVAVGEEPAGESREEVFERSSDLWVARIPGDQARRRVAYRVVTELGTSDLHEIQLARAEGESFRFALFGGASDDHHQHRSVVEALAGQAVDFVIPAGDPVSDDSSPSSWDRFFQIERPLLRIAPVVPPASSRDRADRENYRRYFLHSERMSGRSHFVVDWGSLRLVGLDVGDNRGRESEALREVEEAMAEAAQRDMLIVLVLHAPPYSVAGGDGEERARALVPPLARRYGVELVVSGHDGGYERSLPIDGTVYVASGSASVQGTPQRGQFTAHVADEPHYVLVDVDGESLILSAVSLRGETFDTHVIASVPPAP